MTHSDEPLHRELYEELTPLIPISVYDARLPEQYSLEETLKRLKEPQLTSVEQPDHGPLMVRKPEDLHVNGVYLEVTPSYRRKIRVVRAAYRFQDSQLIHYRNVDAGPDGLFRLDLAEYAVISYSQGVWNPVCYLEQIPEN